MLSVFGDESSDNKKEKVFVVAGLLGDDNQWAKLREVWVEHTKGRVFHAADCESGHGQFKDMLREDRLALHRKLARVLSDSGLIGYAWALDIASSQKEFPNVAAGQHYYSCFIRTITSLQRAARFFVPQDQLEFTFDQHPDTDYNAGLLYQYVNSQGVYPLVSEKISFATRKEIGIQAADLWAREAMKRFDGQLFSANVQPRPQWITLRESKRFDAELLDCSHFENLKLRMSKMQQELGMKPEEYRAWLKQTGRQDSQSNRFIYMMKIDAEERSRDAGDADAR
jgi:hypothetical protein